MLEGVCLNYGISRISKDASNSCTSCSYLFIGRWTIKKNQLFDIQDKRLYKAYLPLFRIIEPNLYQELNTNQIKDLINKMAPIIDEHYELIDPFVIYRIRKIKEDIENGYFKYESFENLCIDIDSDFESIRKSLKLPTRSLLFKLQWGQVKSSTRQTAKEFLKLFASSLYLAFCLNSLRITNSLIENR